MERTIKITEAQRRYVLRLLEKERKEILKSDELISNSSIEWDLNVQLKRLFEDEL